MRRSKQQAGFTLLELLIAIVIVSLVMTTAFAALRIGSRSWEAGQERADSIEEMRSFAEFLRRQVSQTVTASWQDENDERIAFRGRPELVRFVAPAPFFADRVGLLTYALMIDDASGESQLRLEYAPYDPGATGFDESSMDYVVQLATTFESVTFDYYGAVDSDSSDSWHAEWPVAAEFFPKLIRINFVAEDGRTTWPQLLLPLHSRQAR